MNAVVRYTNGATMSYSLNTFMPVEGYDLAFNGTKGRLEVRDYERQPWDLARETEMNLIQNFGKRVKVEIPTETEGHGGGDQRLRDLIFRKIDVPAHMRLPDSRAGAMSCLTGIAAQKEHRRGPADQDRGSGEVHLGSRIHERSRYTDADHGFTGRGSRITRDRGFTGRGSRGSRGSRVHGTRDHSNFLGWPLSAVGHFLAVARFDRSILSAATRWDRPTPPGSRVPDTTARRRPLPRSQRLM